VAQNLAELIQQPEPPTEDNALRIYSGLKAGLRLDGYIDTCVKWKKLSMTTMITEQGHKTTTSMQQYHKRYGLDTACVRAHVTQVAQLVAPGSDEAQLERLRLGIEKEHRRDVSKMSGRCLFLRDLSAEVASMQARGRVMPVDIQKQIVARHFQRWCELPLARRDDYNARVADARVESAAAHGAKLKELCVKRRKIQARMDKQVLDGPIRVSDFKLSDAQKDDLALAFDNFPLNATEVNKLIASRAEAIGPPRMHVRQAIDMMELPVEVQSRPRPMWTNAVAFQRAEFQNKIFAFDTDATTKVYQLTLALQNPVVLGFVGLEPVTPETVTAMLSTVKPARPMLHHFRKLTTHVIFTDEWPLDGAARVRVLCQTTSIGGGVVASRGEWTPLSDCLGVEGELAAGADHIMPAVEKLPKDDGVNIFKWADCPWLYAMYEASKDEEPLDTSTNRRGRAAHADTDAGDVMDALQAARAFWAIRAPPQEIDFRWHIRGGKWTADHEGCAYDCFRSEAVSTNAKDFCQRYALDKSASFYISKYGEETAMTLARFWIQKMQHMLEIALVKGPHHVFTPMDLAGFLEGVEITELAALGEGAVLERIDLIRSLVPRG
jgi:hypothetical protein